MFFLLYRHADDSVLNIWRLSEDFRLLYEDIRDWHKRRRTSTKNLWRLSKTFEEDPKKFWSYTNEFKYDSKRHNKPDIIEISVISTSENIEDITCPRVDMNFIFEWSSRYLTSERSERVRYRVDHEKIKFISISGHVMFCLLYKHQWNTKPFYFNIFNGLERVVTKHGRSTWTKTKFIW